MNKFPFTVVLEDDVTEDKVHSICLAISMIRGVLSVDHDWTNQPSHEEDSP